MMKGLFAAWLTKCDFALWFSLLSSCFLYSAPSSGFVLEVRALQVFHYYYDYYLVLVKGCCACVSVCVCVVSVWCVLCVWVYLLCVCVSV